MEFPFVATKMGFFLHNSRGLNSLVATGIQYDDGSAAALTGAFANVTIGKADVDGDVLLMVCVSTLTVSKATWT